MSMVCGLDLHRQQITFDALETESGEVWRGRLWQPDRERFRRWLRQDLAKRANGEPVALAVEGCTGWRYVVEEIAAAGFEAHLAEPADTQAARGRKRHAKTDRSDSRTASRVASVRRPARIVDSADGVLEWRERVRLYKSLVDQRSVWTQRIHAELFQHGVAVPEAAIRSDIDPGLADRRRGRPDPGRPPTHRASAIDARGHRRRGAPAEEGPATFRSSPAGLSSPGRCHLRDRWSHRRGGVVRARRLSTVLALDQVVRHTGLDVTVDASDRQRASGYLSRQGPGRFAGRSSKRRRTPPAHESRQRLLQRGQDRHDGKLAAISVARQLARRCYHTLRNLDPDDVYAIPA